MEYDGGMEGGASPEARPFERIAHLRKPGETVVRKHDITHVPYRNWRWACVQGRGVHKPHRGRGTRGGPLRLHVLGRRREGMHRGQGVGARMKLATMLSSKSGGHFVLDRILPFPSDIGRPHGDVVVWPVSGDGEIGGRSAARATASGWWSARSNRCRAKPGSFRWRWRRDWASSFSWRIRWSIGWSSAPSTS